MDISCEWNEYLKTWWASNYPQGMDLDEDLPDNYKVMIEVQCPFSYFTLALHHAMRDFLVEEFSYCRGTGYLKVNLNESD